VPSEAIKMEAGKTVVHVPTGAEGDAHTVVPVKVGLDNGVKAEILEGLDEGAVVLITKPVDDPKNGGSRRGVRF